MEEGRVAASIFCSDAMLLECLADGEFLIEMELYVRGLVDMRKGLESIALFLEMEMILRDRRRDDENM